MLHDGRVKFIRNELFLNEFIGVFIPERNTLYNINAVRLLHLYESSLGARESQKKTEKDINNCFYRLNYLARKRGMKFISFRNETHFGIL